MISDALKNMAIALTKRRLEKIDQETLLTHREVMAVIAGLTAAAKQAEQMEAGMVPPVLRLVGEPASERVPQS